MNRNAIRYIVYINMIDNNKFNCLPELCVLDKAHATHESGSVFSLLRPMFKENDGLQARFAVD